MKRLAHILLATACLCGSALADEPYANTQSALSPAGDAASNIRSLFIWSSCLLAAIYIIVMIFALIPAWRRRHQQSHVSPFIMPPEAREHRLTVVVSSAVGITVIILFVLLFLDFFTGNKNHALGHEPDPMVIRVTAHQWWWEVRYEDQMPSKIVNDANEIHVPVGQVVRVELHSGDVIHSFWVPNISGKKDLIPGHSVSLYIRADKPGTYWGQCAEYCGYEHAKMRFAFIAQTPHEYLHWIEAARQIPPPPDTAQQKHGMAIFMGRSCSMCHSITGTQAGSHLGPDLTHIASRQTIAAGTLPNTMGHLGGWIIDPQGIKPGVNMPQQTFAPNDLQDLLEYLETLK